MSHAAKNGHVNIVGLLLDEGADIDHKNKVRLRGCGRESASELDLEELVTAYNYVTRTGGQRCRWLRVMGWKRWWPC